jgi:hypothetical protein
MMSSAQSVGGVVGHVCCQRALSKQRLEDGVRSVKS